MATGYPTRNTTIRLPRGGYLKAPIMAGSGPYGGHDPYLRSANPYANGASQAGALGMGGYAAGGGQGGYVPGGGAAGLAAEYQSAQNRAAAANASLEEELKTGYADRLKRNMGLVGTLSDQSLLDTNKTFDERANGVRRRFGGGTSVNQSTVLNSQLVQNDSERVAALNRARDALTMRKVGLDADLSGDALMQRERVTNAYPDYGQLARLSEGLGEANSPTAPMPTQQQPTQPAAPEQPATYQRALSPKEINRQNSYEASRLRKTWARTPTTAVAKPTQIAASLPRPNNQGGFGIPYRLPYRRS